MRHLVLLLTLLFGVPALLLANDTAPAPGAKADFSTLVFTRTQGFRHKSIGAGVAMMKKLENAGNFKVVHTEDPAMFTDAGLKPFSVIVLMNCSGDILDVTGEAALKKFVESGGALVGVHAATDTEPKWDEFAKLMGGCFKSHPKIQMAEMTVVDKSHPATAHLPNPWKYREEWYDFIDLQPDNHVLLNLEESSYQGGKTGKSHPIAWTRTYGKGRVFYTGLGHLDETYADPNFVQHFLGGFYWTLSREVPSALKKVN